MVIFHSYGSLPEGIYYEIVMEGMANLLFDDLPLMFFFHSTLMFLLREQEGGC